MIGAAPFVRLARKKDCELFTVNLRDIERALTPKPEVDPATILPPEYHEFLDVFSKNEADKLPERRSYDHTILLMEGKEPTYGPLYGMSRDELLVLQKYLTENLEKGLFVQVLPPPRPQYCLSESRAEACAFALIIEH